MDVLVSTEDIVPSTCRPNRSARRVASPLAGPLAGIPEPEWQAACKREAVMRRLANSRRLSQSLVVNACEELGLGRSQVYALLRKYRADPRVTSLIPGRPGTRPGSNRLSPEVSAIIDRCIDTFYLTRQKLTVAALTRNIEHECRKATLTPPHIRTVARRVADLAPSAKLRAREGAAVARQRLTPVRGSLETSYPLHVLQIDHTLVDLMAVDDAARQPFGRFWLTLVLDVDTRMVCGFWISPEPPSTTSVALAITHAVLPKTDWLESSGLSLPWPVAGLPHTLHVDNAREFHSHALKRACQQHGIILVHRLIAHPNTGGHIERLMGTLMKRIQELPGTTFSNIRERGDADPEATAVLTIREFERVFALEVLGPYHHEVHSGLGIPPLVAWAERLAKRPFPPILPKASDEFLYTFLPFKEVVVRREGIRLHNIFYYDDVLTTWLGRDVGKLRAKYDPRDLSSVYLEDPTGRHWRIRYRDLRRPPITLWEQREAVKALRERGRSLVDEGAIFEATEARRAIVAQAAMRTKAARRAQQRVSHLASSRVDGKDEAAGGLSTSPAPRSEVEWPDDAQVPFPDAKDPVGQQHQPMLEKDVAAHLPGVLPVIQDDAEVPLPDEANLSTGELPS